ncbi:MAG: capsular biosynthesis protein [Acidaminobacter sp.]|uniref:YveK family protein n=1 Tax=Acidaminobacter sp. TaxID=1872102 RepID=UPI0013819374|nr:Wzz/FepE/Etk N-terminal domain-containing protein [Acidaminobacter sp.]MZQ98842.1 capsular biosynthesis protein [Acidaminobacter sp.]
MEHEFDTLDLRELFYMLLKHIKLIVTLTLLSVMISAGVSNFLITPEYETFTTLMLGKPVEELTTNQINNQGILTNQQLIGTYAEIAKSKVVINKVVNDLGNTMSPGELRSKISVTLLNNTAVIKVAVRDTDPERAALIANEMAKTFMEEVSEIMKIENVQVIDPAEVPSGPISPRISMNLAISLVLGLMLGIFVSFMLEFLDRSIKTPEEVQQLLGLPVLGMIPEMQEEK